MSVSRPYFSVVIPTYDRAAMIEPTLRSVRDQSFTDWECIVVDDGSKDGAALQAVVNAMGDERFSYVSQPNSGASAARNRGFDLARGSYVALLDSDDEFLPHKLYRQAEEIRKIEGDCLIFSQVLMDRGVGAYWVKPPRGPRQGERIDEYHMCARGWVASSTMVMPTALARRIRFDESLPSSQDADFAIRCASQGARFVFVNEPLVLMDDAFDLTRVSKQPKYEPLLTWIDRMRHEHVSEHAYWGYRGWHGARAASYSRHFYATWLYLQSLVRGAYSPRLAVVVGAQVLLPRYVYQKIADGIAAVFGRQAPQRSL